MFFFIFVDHQNAVDAEKLRGHMETARVASVSKSETAVRTAMANVYFLAKQNLPSSLLASVNSHMLLQVYKIQIDFFLFYSRN